MGRSLDPAESRPPQANPPGQLPLLAAAPGAVLAPVPLTTALQLAPLGGFAIDSAVPQAVVAPLRRALGVDVSGFPVRRGGAVDRAAHRLGARGFTADGVVHIPDHAGALDSRDAVPLLAHELTHAVQQQRFGGALPSAGSATARQLEDEAVAVEEWVGGGAVGRPPLVVRQLAPAGQRRAPDLVDDWEGAHDLPVVGTGALVREIERATGEPFAPRADSHELTDISVDGLMAAYRQLNGELPARPEDHQLPDVSVDGLLAVYQDLRRLAAEQDRDDRDDRTDSPGGGRGDDTTTSGGPAGGGTIEEADVDDLMNLIADNPPRRWFDLDDHDNFEEIANRLYNHLLGRFRFDVLVERERSGTLLDFS